MRERFFSIYSPGFIRAVVCVPTLRVADPVFDLNVSNCADVMTALPATTYAALAGASVLANLSASNITIGKAEYGRSLSGSQSGICVASYLYSAAGAGESTAELAWDGHAL